MFQDHLKVNMESSYNVQKMIWVTFQRVGFHRYPDAPENVKYLSETHRHLFKFRVGIQVYHGDREIEFHNFLNWLESLYSDKSNKLILDYRSCEMIADDLAFSIIDKYPKRDIEIEVSEDGECGVTSVYRFHN